MADAGAGAGASAAAAAAGASASASPASPASPAPPDADTLVQYLVLRRDLKWPTGALVAQGAHAAVAAVWATRAAADTVAYCDDVDHMHKVTLEAGSAEALETVATALAGAGVPHKLWVEQPEGVPTCLATAPGRRSLLKPFFTALRLLR
jgi:peptidyl-tRNA hydrolase